MLGRSWRETVYEQDLGQWHTAPAPIGQPAVFCAADSLAALREGIHG